MFLFRQAKGNQIILILTLYSIMMQTSSENSKHPLWKLFICLSAASTDTIKPQSPTYNLQQTTISNFVAFSKITLRHDIA